MKTAIEKANNTIVNLVNQFSLLEISYVIIFIMSITVKCVFLSFQCRISFRPLLGKTNIFMTVSTLSFALILTAFMIIVYTKRKVPFLLMNIFVSVFLFADAMYFRYYNTIISVPVIYHIKYLGDIGGSAVSLLRKSDILYFIDIPIFILLSFMFSKRESKTLSYVERIIIALLIIMVGFAGFETAYHNSDVTTYDNNYIVKNLGITYFHYFDVKRFVKESLAKNGKLTPDEENSIRSFFDNRKKEKESSAKKYSGIAKGKNLIIVQVEALQQFVIDSRINGKEITPFLNKFSKESLYFNNIYVQVAGGNTADAEFMTNTSFYPASEGAAYFRFAANKYNSLSNILKEHNYNTYAFHAYAPSFWNRTEMYKALGFDTYINSAHYVMDEYVGWGGWALSDASFYRQSLERIDTSKPFYSFFVTLSSHHPYTYFDDKDTFDVGEYNKTYLGNYLKAQNYADSALEGFIESLKEQGLYENSLIVIYGDHTGLPKTQAGDDLMKFLGKTDGKLEWAKLQKTPLIIHCPGVIAEVIEKTGGQVDFYPMIANMLGIDDYYAMGNDIINTSKGYAVLRNGSVVTDDYYYFSDEKKAYDIMSGSLMKEEVYNEEVATYQRQLNISDMVLERDVLRKFK